MEKKSVDVVLNANFYDESAVKQCLKDFNRIFSGRISKNGKEIRITMNNVDGEPAKIRNEFYNYVLVSMKNSGLV